MIDIQQLTFGYNKKPIINQLNLNLKCGQVHGLFGKNGACKSTLLKLIGGHRYPSSGSINAFGDNPADRSVKFLTDSFFINEEPYVPEIPLRSFVKLYSPFYPKFSLEQFFQLLNEFDLPRDMHLKHISMGQRKKAIIAFALACNTKLMLMDEPTNGLDIPSKSQFRKILAHIITDDRLFLISTHQVRDLHSVIDNIVILDQGKIIFNQSVADVASLLNFQIRREPPSSEDILYYERVPGGYICLSGQTNNDSLEVVIETLFNAVISEPRRMNQHFNSTYA